MQFRSVTSWAKFLGFTDFQLIVSSGHRISHIHVFILILIRRVCNYNDTFSAQYGTVPKGEFCIGNTSKKYHVLSLFKALSRNFLRRTEENHEQIQDSLPPHWECDSWSPEHEIVCLPLNHDVGYFPKMNFCMQFVRCTRSYSQNSKVAHGRHVHSPLMPYCSYRRSWKLVK
jgi:hypothetical protein